MCAEGNVHLLENKIFIWSCTSVTRNSFIAEILLLYTAEISRYNGKIILSGNGVVLYGIRGCRYQYIVLGLNFSSELASEGHRCVVF
jgi:hypothetical protein